MQMRNHRLTMPVRRTALAIAVGLGMLAGNAVAQSNITGSIFGQVAAQSGATVAIENTETGLKRSVPVDSSGRYRFSSLSPGRYKVSLQSESGTTVSSRDDVVVTIASGSEVSFGTAAAQQASTTLEGVSVVASVLPSIDVSSVDTRTVLTAEQLNKLPIQRDILAAALLAPGVVSNSSYGVPSFGGAASSENAYFINGYAVTNPLSSIGTSQPAFESIGQQQVLTGGYGAEFGRSTGGVVNIVTKRGTNEWHAGIYTIWEPEALRSTPRNSNYPNTGFYPTTTDGTLYQYTSKNKYWRSTVGAYASGPLIKDRLFFYLDAEMTRREGTSVPSAITSTSAGRTGYNEYQYKIPRWTAKVDWNITDNHLLEFTGISDKTEYTSSTYGLNYADGTHGTVQNSGVYTKDGGNLYIAKYTGYITDDFTVSALYGRQKQDHIQVPYKYDANCPFISATQQARVPGMSYTGCQNYASTVRVPGANDKTDGWRVDLEYRLGDHDLRAGYDAQNADSYTGTSLPGGYGWYYGFQANPNQAIDAGHGVASPASAGGLGTQGYYVYRSYSTTAAKVRTEQAAQFVEDRWQITDRWLLSVGLRNEQFTNFNGGGEPFARQRHQLAPRLGVAWDLFGDSSLKLYANAGRYHLAMPNNVAVRAASGSLNTQEYFTYTGVDAATGAPTGLKSVATNAAVGYTCNGTNAISSNLECGNAPDPRTVAAKGLKSHYQDEYIVGMDQQLSPTYTWGAKITYRKLRSAIDDTCTPALGGACFLFNPGTANTFQVEQADGSFKTITYTKEQLQLPDLKRKYIALDLYLEHALADKWYGRIDYTFSRNYGNTEGQLASDLDIGTGGQTDVSVTQDWDLPQLMIGANGNLPNNRAHQIKAYGFYELNEDWRFGANANIASGRPRNCTSFYPTADRGLYNGSYYYWCGLPGTAGYAFSPRGSHGNTPWTYQLNLNVAYTPTWLDKNVTLQLDVLNVLNKQTPTSYNSRYASTRSTVNQAYNRELNYLDPRVVRFTARYDF